MKKRGIADPRIAVTELQLFAHFGGQARPEKALRPEHLPTPATISEALYLLTLIHAFIRMQGTVVMLTHSATVNHGGGLRKAHERVWANPVHYAHQLAGVMAGGTPLKVKVACERLSTTHSFGHIPAHKAIPAIDAMAVIDEQEERLIVMLLNRSASLEPVDLVVVVGSLVVGSEVEVVSLSGETMYDANTRDEPTRIAPQTSKLPVQDGLDSTRPGVRLSIHPFSLVRLTFAL
jgi:alpha-N-arabinofuranosidase